MSVLPAITHYAVPSSLFSFKDGTFVAEASDLKGYELQRQIYDDACDVGFAIRSERTGAVTKFHLATVKRDNDNDVQFWEFHPTPDHARDPELAKLKVKVFND